MQDFGFHDLPATLLRREIGLRQEHHAHGNAAAPGAVAAALDGLGEKILRDFHMDAGAVTGFAIRIDSAPMPHGTQRIDAGLHHVAARDAIQGGDQAYAAGIVFLGGGVGVA